MNIISIKAELMAICIGLIPAMKNNDTHNIIVITNSITATSKVLKSHVNPFQNIIIPLATRIKSFLSKDNRNAIYYWYCPSKAEWPRHRLVNNQVKAADNTPTLPSKNIMTWLNGWVIIYISFFFSFLLDLLHRRECRKVSCHRCHTVTVTW